MSLITILIDDEDDCFSSGNQPGQNEESIQTEDLYNLSLESDDGLILTEGPLGQ